jgi:hypothetical protein
VFNLSFESTSKENDYADVKDKIKSPDWRNLLFVIAAGNGPEGKEGYDLNKNVTQFVSWGKEPNVLVVGAATSLGVMSQYSNYGKNWVHLVAPGDGIFSTVSQYNYSSTSGTSLAAPQVTAAAAMLASEGFTATEIKARLIYTAEWASGFQDKVLGGLLNVRRAVWQPRRNVITLGDDPAKQYEVSWRIDSFIKVKNGTKDDPAGTTVDIDEVEPISMSRVLRLQKQASNARFRLFYLDNNNKLRLIKDAQLEQGKIACTSIAAFQDESVVTVPKNVADLCKNGISMAVISDYVGTLPEDVLAFW